MVIVRKRRQGNQDYFYLEHTLRVNDKVQARERYLGKAIPKDIERLKKEFLHELYKQRWDPMMHAILKHHEKESGQTPPSAAEIELSKFAVQFTYDTQRIEGSTLSLRETADLLERGITPRTKPMRDVKEAEAHRELFYEMINTKKDISLSLVLDWHRRLFLSTKPDIAGKLRQHQVLISRSRFIPPLPVEVYPLLREFFSWYDKNKSTLHPVELAALVHLKFVTIHPFADGNGRISRLLMNFILHKRGYPLLNIHYEGRGSYYTALERAQTKGFDHIFVHWFFKRYIKEHKRLLKASR
jgi:Fic family protein